jgi:hypothetical protein
MKLRKVDWIFFAGALAVVIGVSLLPTPRDRNPRVPATPEHQSVVDEKGCLPCHQAGGAKPVPVQHPKRQDCLRCHGRQG